MTTRIFMGREVTLAHSTRRMLQALDHYWDVWEIDGEAMEVWWSCYERWRRQVELLIAEEKKDG